MALVCPAGHPPGTGTSFCRLCGRDYVEEANELLAALAPPPTEAVVPEQATSVEPPVSVSVAAPAQPFAAEAFPAPSAPPAQAAWEPPAQALPPVVPVVPGPVAPAAPAYELIPVPASGGLQVRLPLAELPDLSAASELDAELPAEPGKPAPTDTHPVELGGPTLTAAEAEEEPAAAPRAWDRTAVLAGALAGFVGGGVAGAAVTLFLS
jgi:hypothetical protein